MKILKCLSLLVCICLSHASPAIIYRHDVPLAAFVNLARDPQFLCIGLIYNTSGDTEQVAGSCVLVADRYILTATHVFGADLDASRYQIAYNDVRYAIDHIRPYPEEGHDIALVRLKDKVTDVPYAMLNTSDQIIGDTITMVGYGAQRPSDMLSGSVGIGVKTAARNIIDSSGGTLVGGRPSRMYAAFNDSLSDRSVLLPLEGMINGGDSGGGVFLLREGRYVLAGIMSGMKVRMHSKIGFDGSVMYWCHVAAYGEWIQGSMSTDGD